MNPLITKRCSPIEEAIYQDGFQAGAASRDAEADELMCEAADRIEQLEAERDELLADALRYRAIKQWHKAYVLGGIAGGINIHLLTSTRWPEQLDAAIDEAIEKGGV